MYVCMYVHTYVYTPVQLQSFCGIKDESKMKKKTFFKTHLAQLFLGVEV